MSDISYDLVSSGRTFDLNSVDQSVFIGVIIAVVWHAVVKPLGSSTCVSRYEQVSLLV